MGIAVYLLCYPRTHVGIVCDNRIIPHKHFRKGSPDLINNKYVEMDPNLMILLHMCLASDIFKVTRFTRELYF